MKDQSSLQQVYQDFLELPFPEGSGQAVLNDWLEELADIDSYYAGLAETLLAHQPISFQQAPSLIPLFDGLAQMRSQGISERHYVACEQYLLALEKLVKEIKNKALY